MLDYFRQQAQARRIRQFWQWFAAAQGDYRDLPSLPPPVAAQRMRELAGRLHTAAPQLQAEVEQRSETMCALIIGAGGVEEAFDLVHGLLDAAPRLNGWELVPFRQPAAVELLHFDTPEGPITAANIFYALFPTARLRVVDAILIIVADFDLPAEALSSIGYRALEAALGEYIVATQVGQIQFFFCPREDWEGTIEVALRGREGAEAVTCRPLSELKDHFPQLFATTLRD